jgi:hypothetical protein
VKDKRGSRPIECLRSKACPEAAIRSEATATQSREEKERKREQKSKSEHMKNGKSKHRTDKTSRMHLIRTLLIQRPHAEEKERADENSEKGGKRKRSRMHSAFMLRHRLRKRKRKRKEK